MPNIIEITDLTASGLDLYARLTENQLFHYREPDIGLFIAESSRVVERALDAGYIPLSLLLERKHLEGEARRVIARCDKIQKGIPVYVADFHVLTQLTGFSLTRGVLCAMRRLPLPSVSEVCAGARRIAVLENVMNPTNVGAIFRSAAALEMDAVLLTPGSSDPLYRRAVRVSMGTVFQIPWTFLGNSPSTSFALLKQMGFQTAAMALTDRSITIADPRLQSIDKLAIVLGTEGDGLSPETIAACDYTVRIPMSHGVDSLNVAAASAVAFWQLGIRR